MRVEGTSSDPVTQGQLGLGHKKYPVQYDSPSQDMTYPHILEGIKTTRKVQVNDYMRENITITICIRLQTLDLPRP